MSDENNKTAASDNTAAATKDEASKPAAAKPAAAKQKDAGKRAAAAKADLRVTSKRDNFRRAGITFGKAPVELVSADLGESWIEVLRAEPMLVVEDI